MSAKTLEDIRKKLQLLAYDKYPALSGLSSDTTDLRNAVFFRIRRVIMDEKLDTILAFANVFSAFRNMGCRLAFIVDNTNGLSFYTGIIPLGPSIGMAEAGLALSDAFSGVFRGSRLEDVATTEPGRKTGSRKYYSAVMGIPTINRQNSENCFFHMDSLVHAMGSRPFSIVILWDSVDEGQLGTMADNLDNIYADICPWIKNSFSTQEGTSDSTSDTRGSSATSKGKSTSNSRNWDEVRKDLQILQKSLDDELLPRMALARAKGMFNTAVYLCAEDKAGMALLESLVTGIFQGDEPSRAPLACLPIKDVAKARNIVGQMRFCGGLPVKSGNYVSLLSRPLHNGHSSLSTWLIGYEIGILAQLPHEDVEGLEVDKRVGFGLNVPGHDPADEIYMGRLIKDGIPLPGSRVGLKRADLERHIFVSGTTGSGKTTTCHRLLGEFSGGFMVLEPAKTEYRDLLSDDAMRDLLVFTVGNEKGVPFRLNPFEFFPDETISAHIDLLKGCFMASFEMEAAIPNILEQAMYRLYENFGWDIASDTNRYLRDAADAWKDPHGLLFPTIEDYVKVVVQIVKEKGFSQRLEDDYIGSLRGRLESLMAGSKGLMLNTRRSMDFDSLLDKKVVLELEDLKSGEDKAFVMALIIGRLVEALKSRFRRARGVPGFQHILLFEEAHRLLSSPAPGDSQGRRHGVEMFTDLLAEVRKYHECLVIVDQVPSKLAPEILKNTSTKIVHTLFTRDDREALGNAMSLDNEQVDYLSRLKDGQAIIKSRGWSRAAHVAIERRGELEPVEDARVRANGRKFWEGHPEIFCANLPARTDRAYTLEILRGMNYISGRLAGALPRSLKDAEKAKWDAFVREARQVIGEDSDEFLKESIANLILLKSLRSNKVKNLDNVRRKALNKAHHVMAWNETELMTFLNNYKWSD